MIAIQIDNVGPLLNQMLKGNMFDHFLLQEASVTQAFTTEIDGRIRPGFFSEDELTDLGLTGLSCMPFSRLRPLCLDLIKGSRKPDSFRFVFLLSPENQDSTIAHSGTGFNTEDIGGLYLNLTYKNDALVCTTGISYRNFSMDKSLENEWDRLAELFFKQHGVAVTEL